MKGGLEEPLIFLSRIKGYKINFQNLFLSSKFLKQSKIAGDKKIGRETTSEQNRNLFSLKLSQGKKGRKNKNKISFPV